VDQWSTEINTETCPENDDFEMVCVGVNSEDGAEADSVEVAENVC
jgi:hypothetical protein